MSKLSRVILPLVLGLLLIALSIAPASAHDGPDGAEWVMSDWIFIMFAVFAGGALLAMLFAYKAGLLSNLEDAKYHILTIDEPDYYTPPNNQ